MANLIDNNLENIEELSGLSEAERQKALEILKEYSNSGKSKILEQMQLADFKEVPVDIITFIKDDRFLGKAWHLPDGTCKLFPYWEDRLRELFPDNLTTSVNNFIESGARGLGKSEIAVTCGLYMMYRLMCLKNPYEYLNLKPTEKVAFAFMNITEVLAMDIGVSKFQSTVQMSPWFMERGTITGKNELVWNPPEFINIIIGSQPRHVIGQPIYFAFFDEISFIPTQDIEKQKEKAIDMIDTAIGGMKTRFTNRGKNPTLLVLASSKRSEKSFLEEHMKRKLETEGENLIIVDEPVWNIRPASEYCGKKFFVAQGNKYLASEVIGETLEDKDTYLDKGYTILEVPIEYKASFLENIDRALCDFAGISSSELTKYISGPRLSVVKFDEILNPFSKDIIEVGNGPKDKTQYSDFFDMSKVDRRLMDRPMFIHLDMSLSGDKTGIAGIWILGKKASGSDNSAKELYYQLAFSVSIKAPKGYQVSMAKTREFIYWLKSQGFAIKGVTSDTYARAGIEQDLISKGYNFDILSVDRVNSDKICEPYLYLKNTIYEERIKIYDKCELLTEELLGLERNGNTGKVDHPDGGRYGCFTGDTKVSLVDGRELSMLDLVKEFNEGKKNYVYSFNESTKVIEPKPIVKAWKTQSNAKLIEVTLDNGEVLRCTPNHRFMLRDSSYMEAKDLLPGDSLMPLYRKYPTKGGLTNYRMYYETMEDKWHFEHRRFAKEVLDEKYLVHHKDCNSKNNNPDNLVWCSKEKHQEIHRELSTSAFSEEANTKRSNSLTEYFNKVRGTKEFEDRNKKVSRTLLEKTPKEIREKKERDEQERKIRYQNKLLNGKLKREEKDRHIKEVESTFDVNYNSLSIKEKNSLGVKLSRLDVSRFEQIFGISYDSLSPSKKGVYAVRYRKVLAQEILNHKVVSVVYIEDTEDVYDLTIEDNHNFALSSGIFVHNSKDQADAVCGALYNASQHADEFSFEYGETLDTIIDVALGKNVGDKKQITMDFEEELRNAFDPMSQEVSQDDKDYFQDFGMGKATSNFGQQYLQQGIIVF